MPARIQGLALLLLPLVLAGCLSPRLFGPGTAHPDLGVVGVPSGFLRSRIYVVPVADGGVVLIDAGVPSDREAILEAAQGRPVRAILLTHGHVDHAAGVRAWPDTPVYVGRGDRERLLGGAAEPRVLPELGWNLFSRPPSPQQVTAVDDGAVLELGGSRFLAIHLPGHTAGTTAFLWGEVLFSGDALLAQDPEALNLSYWFYSDDLAAAFASLERLRTVPFETVMDGHFGRTDGARALLEARLAAGQPTGALRGLRLERIPARW